jgi:uncharacterized protein YggT (Ycf19 family)
MFVVFQLLQMLLGLWMWTLLGRAVLWMLIPSSRSGNPVYRVMTWVCWPVLAPLRHLLPRSVPDPHIGFYALGLVLLLRVLSYMVFYSQGWIPTVTTATP